MSDLINIGILSTANIAKRHLIPAIKSLSSNFHLSGIASRSYDNASILAAEFETIAFDGYENLIKNNNIDAVYIPLPNALHFVWVKKALLNKKHVLVEKSLGCSFKEVNELTNLSIQNNLVLIENFQFRFHPQLNTIKEILKLGKIGEIRSFRASFGFPPFEDDSNIRYSTKLGGGALLDAGAYTTKVSQIFIGNNLLVKAATLNIQEKYLVDIWGGAFLLNQETGVFAELSFGFDNFYQCGIEVIGSRGKISTNRLFTSPPSHEPEILLETNSGKEIIKVPASNHFENMLLHFYDLVNKKISMDDEHKNNLDQARLLSEIKKKANEK